MSKKELASKSEEQALAMFSTERPDFVGEHARGSEGVTQDDLSLPRLSIIQDLSPQRKKDKDEYIPGAEEGMVFNTATNKLHQGPVIVVPCYFRGEYVAWKDRKAGGGFGGSFSSQDEADQWVENQEQPDMWDVSYTHQHFCVMIHPDHTPEKPHLEDVVVSMSRSQLKPSRKFNTLVSNGGGERFSRAYRLSVVNDKSEKGEFYNWKVEQLGFVSKDIFDRAEQVYEAVKSGSRDVSRRDERAERDDPADM